MASVPYCLNDVEIPTYMNLKFALAYRNFLNRVLPVAALQPAQLGVGLITGALPRAGL